MRREGGGRVGGREEEDEEGGMEEGERGRWKGSRTEGGGGKKGWGIVKRVEAIISKVVFVTTYIQTKQTEQDNRKHQFSVLMNAEMHYLV